MKVSLLTLCAVPFLLLGETIRIPDAPFAMPPIEVPAFADRTFSIADYGARTGERATAAFAAAMDACEKAGGGRVVVPPGRWLTGGVRFRNNCNLHLADGAVLEFTDDPADYPEVHTTWEGIECYNHAPLLFAYGVTNVAITGSGTIAPRMAFWRTWFARPPEHMKATEALYYWCSTNAPVASRRLLALDRAHMRPHLIQFNRCANVLLDGFKIRESPFWMIHLYHSENCVVRHLDTCAHGWNNDGVDVDMTKNVLIEKCRFDQGDDGIVLKAGRNADAWRLNRCTENVVVRDCDMVQSHSLLGIGSELSGGVRNVWMTRCSVGDTFSMLRIKTGPRRGGFVENVWMDHCRGRRAGKAFNICTDYCAQWGRFPDFELRRTRIANIHFTDCEAEALEKGVELLGDARLPPRDIHVRNVRIGRVERELADVRCCLDVDIAELVAKSAGSLAIDMTGAPTNGGSVRVANCTFAASSNAVLRFRNQYAGHVEVALEQCLFDAHGGKSSAVSVENDRAQEPFGGISLRYVTLKADLNQDKLDYRVPPGAGLADVLGNVDLAYGDRRVEIVPFAAFLGLPERDPAYDDAGALTREEERQMAASAERAWNGLRHTLHPKTDLLYEAQEDVLPTPEEIARAYPNVCGWCTGMEDGLLAGGPLLLAALARIDAKGGHDDEAERMARRVFRGLMTCAEVSRVPGFLARAVSPKDGKSFYPSSSRDQYTLFVYAMWKAYRHPFAVRERWQPRIAKTLADVAGFCERTVTKANGWTLARSDGGVARVSKMWTDDVRARKSDGRGSFDFGGIYPHEMARLPMIYAAAWDVCGDKRWRDLYERYADDAIAMSELSDPASEKVFALLQMQASLRLLYDIERNEDRRIRLKRIMTNRTKWALAISCPRKRMARLFETAKKDIYAPYPDWRKFRRRPLDRLGADPAAPEEFMPVQPESRVAVWMYVREMGERMMIQALCPGWRISSADERAFAADLASVDFSRPCCTAPVHALWYYWFRQADRRPFGAHL